MPNNKIDQPKEPSMRTIWVNLLLVFGSPGIAAEVTHPLPVVDGKIVYSEVVPVEGASRAALHLRAKLWFANAFVSANQVVQLDDEANGLVVGKGTIVTPDKHGVKTWEFTVKIQTKDEKYKADIYDVYYKYENDLSALPPSARAILEPERVTYFNLDERFADKTPSRKSMYEKDGTLKKGFPTNVANGANTEFSRLLASIRKQLSEGIGLDDF